MQKRFATDVQSLVLTLNVMGNTFLEDSSDLLTLDSEDIASICVKKKKKTLYSEEIEKITV